MWKVLNSIPCENMDDCCTFNPLRLLNSSVHVNAVVWQLVTLLEETRHSNTLLLFYLPQAASCTSTFSFICSFVLIFISCNAFEKKLHVVSQNLGIGRKLQSLLFVCLFK